MSAAATGPAKSGLGLWPKLALWTLVIVFGALYLGAVKRNAPPESTTVAPETPTAHAPGLRPPPGHTNPEAAADNPPAPPPDAPDAEKQIGEDRVPVSDPAPVRAAESAAFAESLLAKEPGDGSSEGQGGSTDRETASPAPGGAESSPPPPEDAAGDTTGQGAPAAALSASAPESGPTAPKGARGTLTAAPAVPSDPHPIQRPAPGALPPSQVVGVGDGSRGAEVAERARFLGEYETMRRAAEEQMRQYWQQMGVPGAAGAPYGHPGFGYGPGGYPPR
ncbi:MAG: hypothetical protein ACM3ST_05535 [Bdellovibrio bacteriovorus]